ncbi:MAG: hypothetical protein ACP5FL_08005, partial [Thermoplasmatota archaeon]
MNTEQYLGIPACPGCPTSMQLYAAVAIYLWANTMTSWAGNFKSYPGQVSLHEMSSMSNMSRQIYQFRDTNQSISYSIEKKYPVSWTSWTSWAVKSTFQSKKSYLRFRKGVDGVFVISDIWL